VILGEELIKKTISKNETLAILAKVYSLWLPKSMSTYVLKTGLNIPKSILNTFLFLRYDECLVENEIKMG
jgi:hypothetical protein